MHDEKRNSCRTFGLQFKNKIASMRKIKAFGTLPQEINHQLRYVAEFIDIYVMRQMNLSTMLMHKLLSKNAKGRNKQNNNPNNACITM